MNAPPILKLNEMRGEWVMRTVFFKAFLSRSILFLTRDCLLNFHVQITRKQLSGIITECWLLWIVELLSWYFLNKGLKKMRRIKKNETKMKNTLFTSQPNPYSLFIQYRDMRLISLFFFVHFALRVVFHSLLNHFKWNCRRKKEELTDFKSASDVSFISIRNIL